MIHCSTIYHVSSTSKIELDIIAIRYFYDKVDIIAIRNFYAARDLKKTKNFLIVHLDICHCFDTERMLISFENIPENDNTCKRERKYLNSLAMRRQNI